MSLTKESHVFCQHLWNSSKLIQYLVSRVKSILVLTVTHACMNKGPIQTTRHKGDFNGTEYRNVVYSIWDSTLFFQLNPLQIKNNNNFKKAPFVKRFAIVSKIQIQQSLLHECSFSLMTMIHEIKWSIHLLLLCSSLNSFLWTMSWHGEMLAFSKADLHF